MDFSSYSKIQTVQEPSSVAVQGPSNVVPGQGFPNSIYSTLQVKKQISAYVLSKPLFMLDLKYIYIFTNVLNLF